MFYSNTTDLINFTVEEYFQYSTMPIPYYTVLCGMLSHCYITPHYFNLMMIRECVTSLSH